MVALKTLPPPRDPATTWGSDRPCWASSATGPPCDWHCCFAVLASAPCFAVPRSDPPADPPRKGEAADPVEVPCEARKDAKPTGARSELEGRGMRVRGAEDTTDAAPVLDGVLHRPDLAQYDAGHPSGSSAPRTPWGRSATSSDGEREALADATRKASACRIARDRSFAAQHELHYAEERGEAKAVQREASAKRAAAWERQRRVLRSRGGVGVVDPDLRGAFAVKPNDDPRRFPSWCEWHSPRRLERGPVPHSGPRRFQRCDDSCSAFRMPARCPGRGCYVASEPRTFGPRNDSVFGQLQEGE